MNNTNPNNIKVGDTILVEQAWEDESGAYHDEEANVLEIKEDGELILDFCYAEPKVREFLKGTDSYMAADYKPESPVTTKP